MFYEKAVLTNITILAGNLQTFNFIKKRLQNRCFPLNIAGFLRRPILINICWRLLLILQKSYRTAVSSCFCIESFIKLVTDCRNMLIDIKLMAPRRFSMLLLGIVISIVNICNKMYLCYQKKLILRVLYKSIFKVYP